MRFYFSPTGYDSVKLMTVVLIEKKHTQYEEADGLHGREN